jgi:hypothetical protein
VTALLLALAVMLVVVTGAYVIRERRWMADLNRRAAAERARYEANHEDVP